MTQVWTAQFRYPGHYRMDITHATTDRIGKYFAPTKEMVNAYKYGPGTEEQKVAAYEEKYHNLMLARLPEMVALRIWQKILDMPYIVLVCYCPAGAFCHRTLASEYMVNEGAQYIGEFVDFHLVAPAGKKIIDNFHGEHEWASNFSPYGFWFQNIWYPTNEHFFQGWKGTIDDRVRIAALSTPGKAKRAGKKIQLAWNWHGIKDDLMDTGLYQKFTQNPLAAVQLKASKGYELVEGNTWHDNYWGDCSCPKCVGNPGLNKLGKALMRLRETI